jgi:hypothetical protein
VVYPFRLNAYLCHANAYGFSVFPSSGLFKNMSIPSIIFFSVFVLPLVAFFVWLMRQDKRKGITGLVVLAIIVIGGIVYMYLKTGGN